MRRWGSEIKQLHGRLVSYFVRSALNGTVGDYLNSVASDWESARPASANSVLPVASNPGCWKALGAKKVCGLRESVRCCQDRQAR
jgi:hypothetical protein